MNSPAALEAKTIKAGRRLDIVAFIAAFVLGVVLYIPLRLLQAPQVLITVLLVVVMLAYAGASWLVPKLRVRVDQAGDNSYYIGLLFTLMSMAFALWRFTQPDANDKAIISDFGIALATTITGVFLRVVLHQMRLDPAEVEAASRLELGEAAIRLKATLDNVSVGFAKVLDQTVQRAGDEIALHAEKLGTAVNTTIEVIEDRSLANRDATALLRKRMSTAAERWDAATMAVESVTRRMEEAERAFADSGRVLEPTIRSLSEASEKLALALSESAAASHAQERSSVQIASEIRGALQAQDELIYSHKRALEEILATAATSQRELAQALQAIGGGVNTIKELGGANEAYARSALEAQEAAKRVLADLTKMVNALTDVVRSA